MISAISAFRYPILEEGNLSYIQATFDHDFKLGGRYNTLILSHKLLKCPFLERLITKKIAKYSCIVAIPNTGYRKLFLSSESTHEITLDESVLGEPPFFRPQIVSVTRHSCKLSKKDMICEEWINQQITLEKGAILGYGPYYRTASTMQQLLKISLDLELDDGTFFCQPCETNGFYFEVNLSETLYRFLTRGYEALNHRKSIETHIVSRCFEILHSEYSTDDQESENCWKNFSNLRALDSVFQQEGIKSWHEEEFKPDLASTSMYPHLVSQQMVYKVLNDD